MILFIYLIVLLVRAAIVTAYSMTAALIALIIALAYAGAAIVIAVVCLVKWIQARRRRKRLKAGEYARQLAAFRAKLRVMDLRDAHKRGLNTMSAPGKPPVSGAAVAAVTGTLAVGVLVAIGIAASGGGSSVAARAPASSSSGSAPAASAPAVAIGYDESRVLSCPQQASGAGVGAFRDDGTCLSDYSDPTCPDGTIATHSWSSDVGKSQYSCDGQVVWQAQY